MCHSIATYILFINMFHSENEEEREKYSVLFSLVVQNYFHHLRVHAHRKHGLICATNEMNDGKNENRLA